MYRNEYTNQMKLVNFKMPFGGKLRAKNRWVILSQQIPWEEIEKKYEEHFSGENQGAPAKSSRVALGALVIKERLGTSDRETVEQMRENPYLQYFLGYEEYRDEEPFHHSMMTHFRKRFSQECLREINDLIVRKALFVERSENGSGSVCRGTPSATGREDGGDKPGGSAGGEGGQKGGEATVDRPVEKNAGKLIVDATCTPADITYPTDLKLLNDAREKTQEVIDTIHEHDPAKKRKPRTYRKKARKDFLAIVKMKKPGHKRIRKAIGKQLRYTLRNLRHIETMAAREGLRCLSRRQYRNLLVIGELIRQQQWMYGNRTNRISDRIVSITQPHVRPIVRGKAGHPVEFGAKISVSLVDGYGFVDRISWDPYNESGDLIGQTERYRERFGYYPESVHADKIYRTRENRAYCTEHGIRLSGPPLGREPKVTEENMDKIEQDKRQQRQDELDRIEIEGKFGQGKRRFTLARIMAKLAITSEAVIMVSFLVMNLEKILSGLIFFVIGFWRVISTVLPANAAAGLRRLLSFGHATRPDWKCWKMAG